jgi:hypothetical protein
MVFDTAFEIGVAEAAALHADAIPRLLGER